jgi:4-diphosphocytidyl-2-C-methyl-D-erythritol kinase
MTALLATRARAKINLTLRVLGRRTDGYHLLDSLVAFAGTHDALSLEPGRSLGLTLSGPNAVADLPADPAENLVGRAALALARHKPGLALGHFHLVKRLPVASGIGGGSANAAGALRLLARLNAIKPDDPALIEAAMATGADVPVCLASRARIMRGIGEELGPPLVLPRLFGVLVNPRTGVATADVFRALGLPVGQMRAEPQDIADVATAIRERGNDLEEPALAVAPVIGEVLALLRETGADIARMSGSGATCFGLYPDCRAAAAALRMVKARRPGWWAVSTLLS